jgi:hypothetical protein
MLEAGSSTALFAWIVIVCIVVILLFLTAWTMYECREYRRERALMSRLAESKPDFCTCGSCSSRNLAKHKALCTASDRSLDVETAIPLQDPSKADETCSNDFGEWGSEVLT